MKAQNLSCEMGFVLFRTFALRYSIIIPLFRAYFRAKCIITLPLSGPTWPAPDAAGAAPNPWRFMVFVSCRQPWRFTCPPAAQVRPSVGPLASRKAVAGQTRQPDIIEHHRTFPNISGHIPNISGHRWTREVRRVPYRPSPDHVRRVRRVPYRPSPDHVRRVRRVRYGPSPDRVR